MQKTNYRPDKWRYAVFLLVASLLVLADQLSKAWIRDTWQRDNLRPGQALFDLGFLQITNIHNSGAAFGLFRDQSAILTVIAFVGIPAVLACAILSHRYLPFLDNMPGKAALGLILGGTIGNLIDRLRFGYVTDFIDFRIWPTFNLADSAITVGTIMVAYCLLRFGSTERH